MQLEKTIDTIKEALRQGKFTSEAMVSQGILFPILSALDWNVFNTSYVIPEYSLGGRRVDYALCNQPNKAVVFIEVKKIGLTEGADRQLFEYAFHAGVPMAILTDGQEWSFFLPGEQGRYDERRFYKLDLLERSSHEAAERLTRYLHYKAIYSDKALDAARADYKNVSRFRVINDTLPDAWESLIKEQDDLLLDLLAEKVEDICGYKPDLDTCGKFFDRITRSGHHPPQAPSPSPHFHRNFEHLPQQDNATSTLKQRELYFQGNLVATSSARDVMTKVFKLLIEQDPTFLDRFAARKHGRKRRYIDKDKYNLYTDRPDLCEQHSVEITRGWWMGINYSKGNIQKILDLAMEVAGPEISSQFKYDLG